jgi:hypothetical protein
VKEILVAIGPEIIRQLGEGIREYLKLRREEDEAEKARWEQKIEDAKNGKYDTEIFNGR